MANSYRDAGQHQNAIDTYKKRIEIGGWFDEVWHSYYSIGKCYKSLGDMGNAVHWWLEAYNFYPSRIENLFEVVHHYRCNGKNNLAYGFYVMADNERKRNNCTDYLFLKKDIYDYKLDYELSIIGYYCNYLNYDLMKCCMKVLNYPHLEDGVAKNVLSNYKFYSKQLKEFRTNTNDDDNNIALLKNIGNSIESIKHSVAYEDFVSSTPTMCFNNNGELIVNVRFVDYKINANGGYENKGTISTKNVVAVINIENDEWSLTKEFEMDYSRDLDNLYVGLEDVRLFSMETEQTVYFNANRGLSYHNIVIEHGVIDIDTQKTNSGLVRKKDQCEVEKNWVLFEDAAHCQKMIYNWHPLVIGDVQNKINQNMTFQQSHKIETPVFFKHLRGSTNGVVIGDEVWFIAHTVSYEDRRYYYHCFLVLDAATYNVKKYTPYFTFEKAKVEYTLGFVYFDESDEFMIGYSVMDSKTEYLTIDKKTIDDMMIDN